MPNISPHSLEFRREAVRLLRSSGRSVPQLARELGCSPQSLWNWARQLDVDQGRAEGPSSEEREELRRLRRELQVVIEEREILKRGGGLLRQRKRHSVKVFEFVAAKKAEHSIQIMCRVLEVSRSAFTPGRAGRLRRGRSRTPVRRSASVSCTRCGTRSMDRRASGAISSSTTARRSAASASSGSCAGPACRGCRSRSTDADDPGARGSRRRRSARSRLRRRRPEPLLGRRHHVFADLGGVAVSRRRPRPLLAADRRLGDGRSHAHRARDRRALDGACPTPAAARADLAFRPGQPARTQLVVATVCC
jgi:transposase